MKIIPVIAQPLVWSSLYIMIFEMQTLTDAITSPSKDELTKNNAANKKMKVIILTMYLVIVVGIELAICALCLYGPSNDAGIDNPILINSLLGLRIFFKIVVDTLMITKFIINFSFLVREKQRVLKTKYKNDYRGLSLRNRIIIGIVIFLAALIIVYKFLATFLWSFYVSSFSDRNNLNIDLTYLIIFGTFQFTLNFMLSLSLLYLFYYQGSKKPKEGSWKVK